MAPRRSPRPLVLNAASVAFLMLLGTIVYHAVEGLSWVDSLYLACSVVTTVGLGDGPQTALGKAFTIIYNIASLGLGVLLLADIADFRRERWRRTLRTAGFSGLAHDIVALLVATVPAVLGAAVILQWLEGWAFDEALYFTLVTATGLGLGTLEPQQPEARLFFVCYMFLVMGAALHLLGALGNALHEGLSEAAADGGILDWLRAGLMRSAPDDAVRQGHASGSAAYAAADREAGMQGDHRDLPTAISRAGISKAGVD